MAPYFQLNVIKIFWPNRMAHLNFNSLSELKNGLVHGIEFSPSRQPNVCEVCVIGKSHRSTFELSTSISNNILELVHSDLIGPVEVDSMAGSRYILTFLDDFSRKCFVYFLKSKSDVVETFEFFKQFAETQT